MRRIEFDPAKDAVNREKHGLALTDAAWVFDAPCKVTLPVPRFGEERWMDIAQVHDVGVVLVLIYAVRGDVLRPISLRRASKAERKFYHEQTNP